MQNKRRANDRASETVRMHGNIGERHLYTHKYVFVNKFSTRKNFLFSRFIICHCRIFHWSSFLSRAQHKIINNCANWTVFTFFYAWRPMIIAPMIRLPCLAMHSIKIHTHTHFDLSIEFSASLCCQKMNEIQLSLPIDSWSRRDRLIGRYIYRLFSLQ